MSDLEPRVFSTIEEHFSLNEMKFFSDMDENEKRALIKTCYNALSDSEKEETMINAEYFSTFYNNFFAKNTTIFGRMEMMIALESDMFNDMSYGVEEAVFTYIDELCMYDQALKRRMFDAEPCPRTH